MAAPLALVAGLTLAACGGDSYDPTLPQGCPEVSVLREASEVTQFRPGGGRDLTDVVARAVIADYSGECDYVDDPARVEMEMALALVGERGPAASGPTTVDYFVSVIDPQGRILNKRVFSAELAFESGAARGGSIQQLRQVIPLPSLIEGEAYGVIVGFQLTPEQLRFNRERLGQGPALPGG